VFLRLAVTRKGLGIELESPVVLAPGLLVEELTLSLPRLTFPVDLSAGVRRFRHRRGQLTSLALSLSRASITDGAGRALEGLLGRERPLVSVVPSGTGAEVGVSSGTQAIAWHLGWAPLGRDLCFVVSSARGIGVRAPVHALALRATERLLEGLGKRRGSVFRVEDVPRFILHDVLPRAGARLPSTEGVSWTAVDLGPQGARLRAEAEGAVTPFEAGMVRALEVAGLLAEGDDALCDGDLEAARQCYLRALEQAPRQREMVLRLADLDRSVGGRVEAALGTLVAAFPAADAGPLGGELLAAIGDREGARVAYERAAAIEIHASLASLCLMEAAALAEQPAERATLLGGAVIRSPSLLEARWQRLDALLDLGDSRAALAEIEHLEAASAGLRRVEALRRAGERLIQRGMGGLAVPIFERALRGQPADEEALSGLAQALSQAGEAPRAADALARVIGLAEARGAVRHDAVLALARVLSDGLGEHSLAIARARSIPPQAPEALEARWLEARSLARLGDRTRASLAFAVLRDGIERGLASSPPEAARWLAAAAQFEQAERGDWQAARRHLGVALQLMPGDASLRSAFQVASETCEAESQAFRKVRSTGLTPRPHDVFSPEEEARISRFRLSEAGRRAGGQLAETPAPSRVEPVAESPHESDAATPATPEASEMEPVATPQVSEVEAVSSWQTEELTPTSEASVAEEPGPQGPPAGDDARFWSEEPGTANDFPASRRASVAQESAMSAALGEELAGFDDLDSGSAEDDALAEQLTAKVRANPEDLEAVLGLAAVLERLGRDLELFALLSARIEEGDEETRTTVLPLQRAVLGRLAEAARREGRNGEAELYEQMLSMFG
jgi:tetratricopeptide (TPR) repeat protein